MINKDKTIYILGFIVFVFGLSFNAWSQRKYVEGQVMNQFDQPIENVYILSVPDSTTALTDSEGNFRIRISNKTSYISFSHLNYENQKQRVNLFSKEKWIIVIDEKTNVLEELSIEETQDAREEMNITKVEDKSIENTVSVTGDISGVLSTMMGVSTNSELSTSYSVRGGNYDENLIYVNGIKIYRPQLVSAGRQEGLSFVNSDLVKNISFSAGGWQAAKGDKLSSVLDVEYDRPTAYSAKINFSLLGGNIYVGGISKSEKFSYSVGLRHKNTKYLLGNLETQGQYLPKFTDFQSFFSNRFSDRTKIDVLIGAASNDYSVIPEFSKTDFGTLESTLSLRVAFEGREQMQYQTQQAGIKLTHLWSNDWLSETVVSLVRSYEKEYFEVEGAYLLCELGANLDGTSSDCQSLKSLGINYRQGRNKLNTQLVNVSHTEEIIINDDKLEFGIDWDMESFDDRLQEYDFVDSADYSKVISAVSNQANVSSNKVATFVQFTKKSDNLAHVMQLGLRASYWSYNKELLWSPRLQYAYHFGAIRNNTFRFSAGIYRQYPFYRELRDRQGDINKNIKAQSSYHVVAGFDKYFNKKNNPFKLTAELYYKKLWNVNPYDVDNIRIRYFGSNEAQAYAMGADFRIHGEFLKDTESWLTFGLLRTEEQISDGAGYVRRPSDQLINVGVHFQDHLLNDPTTKVNLNFLYGSGFPFSPLGRDDLRNKFQGDNYLRVDMGMSKNITFSEFKNSKLKSIWIGVEVLNLLAVRNTISYTWIKDSDGNSYAVPNALTARFLNFRLITKF